ncbi:MAG: thioredoxin domain-containing protein [Actinobacteria bacterium]|nr:thioredoxin domain-containing protein [Actinomycetota bacterium]
MPNRLADETSPYLLQHKDNPVDWQPWGERALAEARERDVPLLVSIGYSACHWCHVMERESFEDPDVAAYMNEHFVCVKVDREERPDVDAIYMDAVQAMTGHGGWPLNAFATPDQVPFYAGTYFPPVGRQGLPGWRQLLEAIAEAWRERRAEIERQGAQIVEHLGVSARIEPDPGAPEPGLLETSVAAISDREDHVHGGFGGAPKFPQASAIELLLARHDGGDERPNPAEPALRALRAMARGGIYDQLGGGFARYAVDAAWVVPHFEKMLYDNALLARAYLHGWQIGGDPLLRQVCTETLDWALREMRGPERGFASALDADSEGVEGKFYVWTPDELRAALDDERLYDVAVAHWGVTEQGNFEGRSILVRAGSDDDPPELPEIKRRLMAARDQRVRPGLDDKRLTSWNALMLAALAEAGAVLERADYLDAARACADFLLRELSCDDGRLLRTWKAGRAHLAGYLEDHAFLLEALLTLYEATFEPRWFAAARALADVTIARFADDERGGFFSTADDHERLVARRKDLEDTPIPSGNAAMALGLLRLARLTGEDAYEQRARGTIALLHPIAARHPLAFAHLLRAIDFLLADDVREVAIVGDPAQAAPLARTVRDALRPHVVLAGGPGDDDGEQVPLLAGRTPGPDGRAAAYVCERFACRAPVTEPDALAALLD